MRFSVPITITKAGAQVTPHLVSVHLGGSSNVDALGFQKSDGSVVLFKTGDAAVVLDESGKINIGFDYNDASCFFGQDSEQAYTEFASEYEWMTPSLSTCFNEWDDIANHAIYIADPETGDNMLVAYDICIDKSESNIGLPLDVFVPEIDVDPETAFVTTCEVEGRTYLALSINNIIRPIFDAQGNKGCQVAAEGATFNVDDCSNVNAAGIGMAEMPMQAALGSIWRPRSCSIDGVIVTTKLSIETYMLASDFVINSEVITDTSGTWYIPISQFTVNEA